MPKYPQTIAEIEDELLGKDESQERLRDSKHVANFGVLGWVKSTATKLSSSDQMELDNSPPFHHPSSSTVSGGTSVCRVGASAASQVAKISTEAICSYPHCVNKLAGGGTFRFHCVKCNGTYCQLHAGHPSLEAKVDLSGNNWEVMEGKWTRVCHLCFHSRPGYELVRGVTQSRTMAFRELRARHLQTVEFERNRLEKRLEKLSDYRPSLTITGKRIKFAEYAKRIVPWKEEASVEACYLCKAPFTVIHRKHHCRLCGEWRVDVSNFPPIAIDQAQEIRACHLCDTLVFHRAKFTISNPSSPRKAQLNSLYATFTQLRDQIEEMLPKYNELLIDVEMEHEQAYLNDQKIQALCEEATTIRDTLTLLFHHFDRASASIKAIKTGEHEYQRMQLYVNIARAGNQFLQKNLFTLRVIPKRKSHPKEIATAQRLLDNPPDEATSLSSSNKAKSFLQKLIPEFFSREETTTITTLRQQVPAPANMVALLQKLEVLQEHKFQLEAFIDEAVQRRKFDNVKSLRIALDQVNLEIEALKEMCSRS